jgi:hypothetical protein
MRVFKTSAPVPSLESMMNPEVFDDIREFYDFYLESIRKKLQKKPKTFKIHSEILTPTGLQIEWILDKENYHLTLKRCELYFVMTEEYEKAHECLQLLKKLE